MSERQNYENSETHNIEHQEEKYERTDVVQRAVQLLPTGINVKMWSKYGEAVVKGEILYVF
jgi:UDP-N-acetyl-D-mannosaminuronic acid transferase (WecB/TagA/CpsF family)